MTQAKDVEEFFMGCLRFRGTARSLDVGRLIQDQRRAEGASSKVFTIGPK